jgi:hypothetical protein
LFWFWDFFLFEWKWDIFFIVHGWGGGMNEDAVEVDWRGVCG